MNTIVNIDETGNATTLRVILSDDAEELYDHAKTISGDMAGPLILGAAARIVAYTVSQHEGDQVTYLRGRLGEFGNMVELFLDCFSEEEDSDAII